MSELAVMLRAYVAGDEREDADRCAMLRLAEELEQPFSRKQLRAHFTASAFVVDETGERACLVQHATLGRLLQPGGHVESIDSCLADAALREAREETGLELELHPEAPRPFDLDIHAIPAAADEPAHFHLDVRYLVIGRGEPVAGAAWHAVGEAGDGSVARLASKAAAYRVG